MLNRWNFLKTGFYEGINLDGLTTGGGGRWNRHNVSEMTADQTYRGVGYYARKRRIANHTGDGKGSRVSYDPREEWIEVPYPPIVDEGTWELAQHTRRRHKRLRRHKGLNLTFPLRGLVRCGSCGHRFNTRAQPDYARYKQPNGTYELRLSGRRKRQYMCHSGVNKRLECDRKRIGAVGLERTVWDVVRRTLEHPETVAELLEARQRDLQNGGSTRKLAAARKELAAFKEKEQRAVTAYVNGYIDQASLEEQLAALRERIKHFEDTVGRLESEEASLDEQLKLIDHLGDLAGVVSHRLDSMTPESLTEVIQLVVDEIVIQPDHVEIVLALGNAGTFPEMKGRPARRRPS